MPVRPAANDEVMEFAMKTAEYRGLSDEELGNHLRDTQKRMFELRFQSATDRLETPSQLRKARREIARIKTLQRERELKKAVKA
jgi:large subunit ribosomal protein L29